MTAFDRLVAAAGLSPTWTDADGAHRQVDRGSLLAILDALGRPGGTDRAIADSLARIEEDARDARFASADIGVPVDLPPGIALGPAELLFEDGSSAAVTIERGGRLAAIDVPGYHQLVTREGIVALAIAPPRCWGLPPGRHWGAAVQIAAMRGAEPSGFGDFATLAEAATAFGTRGADALAINPVHALFPADASRFSPYAPSSRLFLNALLGDAGADLAEREAPALIDWTGEIPQRLLRLRRAYDALDDASRVGLAAFRAAGGRALDQHALFDALHARFGGQGWQHWPAAYHDPDAAAVRGFAAEADFYAFVQWRAHDGLAAAQAAARAAGMRIGLVADLAVGMDAGGSHAWSRRGDLLTGLSIGAPPDPLGPSGQQWGITALAPDALRRTGFAAFKETLRATLAHAGGLRIDHALGLCRLWVVPEHAPASAGAYLAMPLDDLLRITAIESHRAQAIVIGEDLGTVPPGFRDVMTSRGLLGMAVLPFEGDKPAAAWSRQAVAMTGTHDTPTIAGWWQGRDLDWRARIDGVTADHETRATERDALWSRIGAGAAPRDAGAVVDAAIGFVGDTPCPLVIVPFEDLLAEEEQPNLPGTTDEHPNWRRRMPAATDALLDRADVARRIATLNKVHDA